MKTKKFNNQEFAWDPNAFGGKGYWFAMGKKGGLGRAASKKESEGLGKVSKAETEPASDRVFDYKHAKKIGKSRFSDLIADKIMAGQGVGSSVKQTIGEKMKAQTTRIKEKFDPLNILSALTGRSKLGTALAGRLLGRNREEVEYQVSKGKKGASQVKEGKATKLKGEMGQTQVSSEIFEKIYKLMRDTREEDKRKKEIEKNFAEEQKLEDEERHKKLIAAILDSRGGTTTVVSPEKKTSLLDDLMNNPVFKWIREMGENLMKKFEELMEFMKGDVWNVLKGGWKVIARALAPFSALLVGAGLIAALIGSIELANWWTDKWRNREIEKAQVQGGEIAVMAEKDRQSHTGDSQEDIDARQTAEATKQSAIERKNKFIEQFLGKKGYEMKKGISWNPFKDPNVKEFKDAQGKAPPPELMNEARAWADEQITKVKAGEIADPQGVYKQKNQPQTKAPGAKPEAGAGGGRGGQGGPSAEQLKSAPPAPSTTSTSTGSSSSASTPETKPVTATPQPVTPSTAAVNEAVSKNVEMNNEVANNQAVEPIVVNNSSTQTAKVGGDDQSTVTGAAPVRDDELHRYTRNNLGRVAHI